MTRLLSHRAFGYSIVANQRIEGLSLGSVAGAAEMHVRLQDTPEFIRDVSDDKGDPFYVSPFAAPNGEPSLRAWHRAAGEFFVLHHWDGSVCVVDRSGDRLWLTWPTHVPDPEEFLLGSALGLAMRLRGDLCLHASAVVVNDRAVLLAGPSASGKSTLAAVLGAAGHPVVTDDVAVVARTAAGSVVEPGPRRIRLRRGGAGVVQLASQREMAWTDSPGGAFEDVWLDDAGVAQASTATRIDAIYFLDPSGEAAAAAATNETLDDMPRADAVMALVVDSWAARLQDPDMRRREFELASDLVASTRLRRLRYRADESSGIRSAADRIVGDATRKQDAA